MKFNKLAEKAKQAIDRRGGMDALKEDLQEVKDAATSRGSFGDKARRAADAVKTPGRNARDAPPGGETGGAGTAEGPGGPDGPRAA